MIGAREAVVIAKEQAAGMLGQGSTSLEEIERDSYKGRDMWIVTLGFPRDLSQVPPLARISMEPLQYKRFLVDAETGELVAIKLRELASR